MKFRTYLILFALMCLPLVLLANTDFALIDTDGNYHKMSYYSDYEDILIIVQDETLFAGNARLVNDLYPNAKVFLLSPGGKDTDNYGSDYPANLV
ncbi:MAG: hypothetical protein VW518_02895 [Burkholderiaceae bacterium]